MAESSEAVELVLEDEAKQAISQIAWLLGKETTEEEAVQRALGTELFLLEQVKNRNGRIFVETKDGRLELDLFNK